MRGKNGNTTGLPFGARALREDPAPTPAPAELGAIDAAEVRRVALIVGEVLKQLGLTPTGASDRSPVALPAFMAMRELAARIGLSESTGWRWHAAGKIGPAGVRRGGRRLFDRAEVEAWLQEGAPARDTWVATWAARKQKRDCQT